MPGYYVLHYNGAEALIIIQCQDTTTLQWSWSTNNITMPGYYYTTMEPSTNNNIIPGYYYITMEPSTTNNTMPGYYVLHYNGAKY